MKPTTVLSTGILASAYANPHAVAPLLGRAIDPATMDPTKLSVLSVLKTAMPTAADAALPTGTASPQWYKDLPADVMVLLAQIYPAISTAASASNATSFLAQETASVSLNQTTLTKTLEEMPTATGNAAAMSSGSLVGGVANGTLAMGLPSATQSVISTGAKNVVGMGRWSFVVGMGVAMCFFAFA